MNVEIRAIFSVSDQDRLDAGLQIIFLSWKDIGLTKSPFWLDKTEMSGGRFF